ncbi:MAG: precorrin-2 dehydrogenase/sirohydrochlorin ferrochelatase family protein, partial [Lachnospiraceae bacterium]
HGSRNCRGNQGGCNGITGDNAMKAKEEQQAAVYFPLFVNLENRNILFVGAGEIASRRVAVLKDFGARITVVAPSGTEQLAALEQCAEITWKHRVFMSEDLDGCDIVFAATNDTGQNDQIAGACRDRKILVNHAGDRHQSDFYFPGIARDGQVVAGVTTSGSNHRLAGEITQKLQQWLKQFGREERTQEWK